MIFRNVISTFRDFLFSYKNYQNEEGDDEITILENLWFGNLNPGEEKPSNEAMELIKLIGKQRDEVADLYPGNTAIDKLIDVYEEYLQISEKDAFIKGFNLATKIMTEVNNFD